MASVSKRGGKSNRHGYWYASWWEFDGGRQRRRTKCTRTTDKATAERIARKHEAEAALRREGVVDVVLEGICKESQKSVEEHLADYKNKLQTAGRAGQYINETAKYIRKIAESCKFRTVGEIDSDEVNQYATDLKDEGRSARTIQANLAAIKGFSKWLAVNNKLPRDPLASVRKPNPKTDRRRERRMLLPREWCHLEKATLSGPCRYGMTGLERIVLYRTAIEQGSARSNCGS